MERWLRSSENRKILSNSMLEQIQNIEKISKFTQIDISDLEGNIVDTTGDRYTKVHKNVRKIIENDKVYIKCFR